MKRDEARTLLVEQGAQLIDAGIRHGLAVEAFKKAAVAMCSPAALEHDFSLDEQIQCFRESCGLLGVDPNGDEPTIIKYRNGLEMLRMDDKEQALMNQLASAPFN